MELTIEQQCPACGASIVVYEDDRFVHCEYCDVANVRVYQKLPRYILPARLPSHVSNDDLLYVPYLRFKGCIYYCKANEIRHKLIDTTRIGCSINSLPVSLGLRPQTMTIQPVTVHHAGRFVRQTIKADKIFSEAARLTELFSCDRRRRATHRAFIGETISRVYLPVYFFHDSLYDGVNHIQIGQGDLRIKLEKQLVSFKSSWEPRFISTSCPDCGDIMQSSREGLAINCVNCEKHWVEEDGKFSRLDYAVVRPKGDFAKYIPFWQIEPDSPHQQINTLADFLQLTNQPVVVQPQHRKRKFSFIVPAFKMKPDLFLQTAKNFTVLQLSISRQQHLPLKQEDIYPVTLSHDEAVESLTSILIASAVSTKRLMEILPAITFSARKKKLVYLPFNDTGHDYIEQYTGVAISSAALRFGRKL